MSKNNISLDDVCKLVEISYDNDELQQKIEIRSYRPVFCCRLPLSRNEFYLARQSKIRPAVLICVNSDEYRNEPELEYQKKTYTIYKVYEREDDITELYGEERQGGGYEA